MIFEGYDLLYNIIVTLLVKSAEEASRILIMAGVGITVLSVDSLPNWFSDGTLIGITSHSNNMVPGVTDCPI